MAEFALAGLRWAASPVINKLIADASAYLSVDMARELQQLEATVLPQFDLVIQAAEKSPHRAKLEAWLRRLKTAFYDLEDLLDEREYNQLERKAMKEEDLSPEENEAFPIVSTIMKPFHVAKDLLNKCEYNLLKRKAPSLGDNETSIASTILTPFRAAKRRAQNLLPENRKLISQINDLKDILMEAKELRDLLAIPPTLDNTAGVGWPAIPETIDPPSMVTSLHATSSLSTSQVFGRKRDRDHIVDFLLGKKTAYDESSTRYSSLAIVGAGGMGKSTLAQYVYNDKRIEEGFDVRMWVCISRKLDVRRHTREIIESATKGVCPHIDNLDTLQCKLRDILQKSEKFLLVLDDVWFEKSDSETEWFQLLDPLVSKQSGSKVLVTSRRETLPAVVCCEQEQIVHLENMDGADFLALFKHHAFSGAKIGDQLLHRKLEHTAEEIAKRLGQCPLAAKVLGSRLSTKKDVTEWKAALKLRDLSEPFTALLWSYKKLDPNLQRCFLYCSLFPKGHRYQRNELLAFWVAEGFVDSHNLSSTTMEDVAGIYFTEMVTGSFFQQLGPGSYIMHDILHDLAESLSREDCFRLEDDNVTEIPCTVRHLSVEVESMQRHKEIITKLRHLRTVICINPLLDNASVIFDHILQNQKKLRVLHLSFYNSSKLPESVGEMKHLRYLDLSRTSVSELPTSLCALYHLQLLQLNRKVERMPDKVCSLSKLRHLQGYTDQIPNIGKLTSLQCINDFSVQKKQGYELRQLKDLNELGSFLTVKNLENVTGKDEALESKLYQKNRLKGLSLIWSCKNGMYATDILHLDILEGLRPPSQLSSLTIRGYKSDKYPRWLLEQSYFGNLESFSLHNCSLLEGLPQNTELLQHCSSLQLWDIPNLKTLSCLPASLTRLSIRGCPLLTFVTKNQLEQQDLRENMMQADDLASKLSSMWEVDSGSDVRNVLSQDYSALKQLMTLVMDDDITTHLQILESGMEEGGDKECTKENIIKAWLFCHEQRIKVIYGRTMELPLVLPSGLRKLHLSSCSITDEALAVCLGGLTSLTRLSLNGNMALTALPSEQVFQHLAKLKSLTVYDCWCLRSLGGSRAAPSLSSLDCTGCPSLDLTRGAEFMALNLDSLHIRGCILAADSFINGLPDLKSLSIYRCRSSPSLSIGHLTSLESLRPCLVSRD